MNRKDSDFEGISLVSARNFVRQSIDKGLFCPGCDQWAKKYKRKLNGGMAAVLVKMVAISKTLDGEKWFHVNETLITHGMSAMALEYSKLKHWGLIDQAPTGSSELESGLWRVTDKGYRFASGEITVPRFVHLYNNEVLGYSEEHTTVLEALGDKFDYSELMKGNT